MARPLGCSESFSAEIVGVSSVVGPDGAGPAGAGKAARRGRLCMHSPSETCITLVSQEIKAYLRLPGSIWEAERNSCVPCPPAEAKELGGVASLINPAVSIFQTSCPPIPKPLRNEAGSLGTSIKCFPERAQRWAAERLRTALSSVSSWGRDGGWG